MAFSGGMDSTGLLMRLLADGFKVSCVTYDYGQKHVIEIDRAINNIKYLISNDIEVEHKIANLSSVMGMFHSSLISGGEEIPKGHYEKEQMKSTVVPNRNAIFSSILYGYALSIALREDTEVKIALGVHSGDHAIYPDCRPEFYESLEESFALGNWNSERVSLHLPYIEGNKEFILRDALVSCKKLGLDFDTVFANTNTSYNPDKNGRSSGTSGADVERILAFHAVGREDPVEYVNSWKEVLSGALKSKFNSDCGWPAFSKEIGDANITQKEDHSYGMTRIEVRCSGCNSHLGHLFHEVKGPRYCINSICLDFEGE